LEVFGDWAASRLACLVTPASCFDSSPIAILGPGLRAGAPARPTADRPPSLNPTSGAVIVYRWLDWVGARRLGDFAGSVLAGSIGDLVGGGPRWLSHCGRYFADTASFKLRRSISPVGTGIATVVTESCANRVRYDGNRRDLFKSQRSMLVDDGHTQDASIQNRVVGQTPRICSSLPCQTPKSFDSE
jgi:hypothetical protein